MAQPAPTLRQFLEKFRQLEPHASYRKLYRWAESGVLPTHPRFDREFYRVKFGKRLFEFLLARGNDEVRLKRFLDLFLVNN